MAALFGMDSFGTGFLVQSLLALWLYRAFQVSVTTTATILFWSGVCSAVSYLVAVPIAERIGLINTMLTGVADDEIDALAGGSAVDPLQGLPPQWPGAVSHDDARARRVHQALPAPRSTQGFYRIRH
jgi:hypothetical protein